jgi:indole-3-acetate monooxygenase
VPNKRLRDDVFVQEAVGRADTLLTSARAHLFDVVGDMWDTLVADKPLSEVQEARFMTLNSHVIALCVEVVQLVFKASGGTAVYQKGPLDRCLRDVLTMNQHVVATLRTWEMSGRLLLGLEALRWLF